MAGNKRLNVFGEPWSTNRPGDGPGDRKEYWSRYHAMRYGVDEAYTERLRARARRQYLEMTPEQRAKKAAYLKAWRERKRNERRDGAS